MVSFLSEIERARWDRSGWLLLKAVLPAPAVSELRGWVDQISQPGDEGARRLHYYEETPRGPALCRTERFLEDHRELCELMTAGLLPGLVSALAGEPMVLYKEKINHKQPSGAGFAAHQDATAYPQINLHITALVPVDPMTPENGCLEMTTFGERVLLPYDDNGCLAGPLATELAWRRVSMEPGDVLFFTSYVPHRSGPNRTSGARRALYLTYNRAADGDLRTRYYAERDEHLRRADADNTSISMIKHFQGTRVPQTD